MARRTEDLVKRWLRLMKVPVSATNLKQRLLAHPDHSSVAAVTDTLDELGIDNATIEVDKEKYNELPFPFMAAANGGFRLFENREKFLSENTGFLKHWNGIAVLAEKPDIWKQHKENEKLLAEERKNKNTSLFFLLAVTAFVVTALWNQASFQNLLLASTTLAGLFISFLIVQHELGFANPLTEQLCGLSKHADCDAVLHSKQSRLFAWLNWADMGIIYFSAVFIAFIFSLMNGNAERFQSVLVVTSTCTLPFTFISIYYQWRIVKKWCTLCLLTVAVLWAQFILLLPATLSLIKEGSISFNNVLATAFTFLLVAGVWLLLLKPVMQQLKEKTDEGFKLLRFKNNPDLFTVLLHRQRRVDTTPFENDLQLGNTDAPLQIMVACNPYCGPCAKAHEVLNELVERNELGVTVRFTIKADNKEDKKTQALEYILQLLKDKEKGYKRNALHRWYELMNIETFEKEYPLQKMAEVTGLLLQHEKWVEEAGIKATPTIFINGFELPKQYQWGDLKDIIVRLGKSVETTEKKLLKII